MTKVLSSQEVKKELIQKIEESTKYGKDTANRMISVIEGYGKREGFFNKIGGFFYRIWNVVKAIFGKSDWQLARKAMNKEFDSLSDLSTNIKFRERQKKLWYYTTDAVLLRNVNATYFKVRSTEELDDKLVAEMFRAQNDFTKKS
jgi:hypothetical protein